MAPPMMRRGKVYVTDVRPGDRVWRHTASGEWAFVGVVFRWPTVDAGMVVIHTSTAGTDTTKPYADTRMVWIEIR